MDPGARIRALEEAVEELSQHRKHSTEEVNARILELATRVQGLETEVNRLRQVAPPAAKELGEVSPPEGGSSTHKAQLDEDATLEEKHIVEMGVEVDDGDKYDWEVYEFQRSIWDVCMFVGLYPLGLLGSIMVSCLGLLTVAMQLVFCALINDNLTTPLISSAKLQAVEDWRTFYGHDIRYMDDITQQSMARLVCDKKDVIFSTGQKSLLESIVQYLRLDPVSSDDLVFGPLLPIQQVGPLMCVIALLVWYMTLLKDVDAVRALTRAMQLIPRGPTTRINSSNDAFQVECLSIARKGLVFTTILLRFFVHFVLIWSGSLYLANTISLADLILNSVALETVLTLDSLVFEAFAPHDSKKFISLLSPLPQPKRSGYRGMDWISVAGFVAAVSLTLAMLFGQIIPQANIMMEARDAMCGGNVDFVSTVGNDGLVMVYPSAEHVGREGWASSYTYRAIREAIVWNGDLDPRSDTAFLSRYAFGITGSQRSVAGYLSVSRATSILNPFCRDLVPGDSVMNNALFREVFGFSDGDADAACTHSKVLQHCPRDAPQGVRARQYCPEACGCRNLSSSLILTHPDEGCPGACTLQLRDDRQSCDDLNVSSSEMWESYRQGLRDLNASWFGSWKSDLNAAYDWLGREGCAVVPQAREQFGVYLCSSENQFHWKPLTFLCPETCGCASDSHTGCPSVCSSN